MHRSCLSAIMIDCRTEDAAGAARFWGAALGSELVPEPDDPRYVGLAMPTDQPLVTVQAVAHESRIHLDIETDDIAAEVRRLEALGAVLVEARATFTVMRAPTGQRFCVVRARRPDFAERATVWGDGRASG